MLILNSGKPTFIDAFYQVGEGRQDPFKSVFDAEAVAVQHFYFSPHGAVAVAIWLRSTRSKVRPLVGKESLLAASTPGNVVV